MASRREQAILTAAILTYLLRPHLLLEQALSEVSRKERFSEKYLKVGSS